MKNSSTSPGTPSRSKPEPKGPATTKQPIKSGQPIKSAQPIKSVFNSKPKVLYAADSIGHTASVKQLEDACNARIRTARSYSSAYDKHARWPKKNFTDVVKDNLANPGYDNFDVLVMSAPTVDITNLDTTHLAPTDNIEVYKQNVIRSTQNMFSLAQATLGENRNLSKVIIMEHPPRFDTQEVDPTSLKNKLAIFANTTLSSIWLNSPLKDRIIIGRHSLESPGVGPSHQARYRGQGGRYDGVYGKAGSKDYTTSVRSIISMALPNQDLTSQDVQLSSGPFDHKKCPQTKYLNRKKNQPSVKTQNRFSVFNSNLGNF